MLSQRMANKNLNASMPHPSRMYFYEQQNDWIAGKANWGGKKGCV
jgi:hypothetical protein